MAIKNKLKGFTLVELTVSMGVLALIVGLTAGILITVVRSYQRQRVISEIERNGDFIMRTIEESFRGATSVGCTDYAGNPVALDAEDKCVVGSPINRRLIYIQNVNSHYFGLGSEGTGSASCDPASTSLNCFIYKIDSNPDDDISAGNLVNPNAISLSNDADSNGIHISAFNAAINGGGPSGEPYNITVTIEVKGSQSSSNLWPDEARTFQSFLTVRGTYQ